MVKRSLRDAVQCACVHEYNSSSEKLKPETKDKQHTLQTTLRWYDSYVCLSWGPTGVFLLLRS